MQRGFDHVDWSELAILGAVVKPDENRLKDMSAKEGFNLNDAEIHGVSLFFDDLLSSIDTVEKFYTRELESPSETCSNWRNRNPGRRPDLSEDPYNAFVRKFLIEGAKEGPLRGKKIGIKDNINVAGIPTTNASALSENYVPHKDATIVTRLLDAGADIVGKLNMDNLSFSGTSETSIFGPVRNPVNTDFSPGGSSSGSGAAVAAGLVDIAIGVDQGGSARVPACCTGIVSIKPTHGLVPTYGLTYMDHTLDHICPITRNVDDAALVLEVIAGHDKKDPQWKSGALESPPKYSAQLKQKQSIQGIRIGAIKESLSWPETDPEIKGCFTDTLERLERQGAVCEVISIPLFAISGAIWITAVVQATHAMYDSSGEGYWHGGEYNPEWNSHIGRARKELADKMTPLLKCAMIAGRYLREDYFSTYHSKAQNLRNLLREKIDEELSKYDLLATPTMIVKPPRLKLQDITFAESLRRGVLLLNNTTAFNLSGHPAITIPCGSRGGFPVGLQLIGKHFQEMMLFRVAKSFESEYDWRKLSNIGLAQSG